VAFGNSQCSLNSPLLRLCQVSGHPEKEAAILGTARPPAAHYSLPAELLQWSMHSIQWPTQNTVMITNDLNNTKLQPATTAAAKYQYNMQRSSVTKWIMASINLTL